MRCHVFELSSISNNAFAFSSYAPEYRRIRAGTTFRNEGGVVHYVEYDVKNPGYGVLSTFDADINVFKLTTPLVWTPVIQMATIIQHGFDLPDNFPVVHAGWGTTTVRDLTYIFFIYSPF